jgi:hypothetical protein
MYEFEDTVFNKLERFAQPDVREALTQVIERDEFDHLVSWVWTFHKR